MKYAHLSDLLSITNIKTESQLMTFSDSSWQDFPDTGRIIGAYIIFYQGVTIDYVTYVPGPVSQSSAESEYNAACAAGMDLAHFIMSIHESLNKDPYIVPEESPLVILDKKSSVCMAKNSNDTNHTSHIVRRVHFVRNGEKSKIHNIVWCEGGLQL